ncbi:hypothetical protein DEO72_LG9g2933 [Vigna unguiculata]|uniref:Uncharacterized protein n=1 Tax=Vigna unguiculata TaxID=3917 RepID=A0A4D6N4U2_VIGUN|nr:hypothetical protein DEO72_LG9g2933 [Vigna unguiculata]
MCVNPSKPLEEDAQGWPRSKEQGSISSAGASQCFFAGQNELFFPSPCFLVLLYIFPHTIFP